jgi:two-component system sensor histidine kinase TctE
MIAQLQLLARDAAGTDLSPRLLALHEGATRLAHTANQLLALARSEPTATTRDDVAATVDLEGLATDAVARHLDRSLLLGIDLGAETRSALTRGSDWLLRELLENLVDNALAYTPGGGRVTVRSGLDDVGDPYLEVEDDGPGIPVEQRGRVRERFHRLPDSPGNGCGLGLAIVDEITRLHDASFRLDDGADGRGTRARVTFARVHCQRTDSPDP